MAVLKALPGAPDFKALPGSAKINGEPIKDNQPIKGKLISIKKSVINIGKFLDRKKKQTEKQKENFRKRDQNFKRKKKEEKLEEPKQEWKKLVPKKVPGLSFLDSIKKFVSGWILGFVAIKLIPLLPSLIPVVINLGKMVNFIINLGGKFLNGFISFIDFGMKAQAATLGFIKNLGGEKFANAFERFMKFFGFAIDSMLILGALMVKDALSGDSGFGLGDILGKKGLKKGLAKLFGKKVAAKTAGGALVKTTAGGAVKTAAGVGAGTAAGIVGGVGLLASGLGEGAFQIKKQGQKVEEDWFKRYKDKKWPDPRKLVDWGILQVVKGFNYIVGNIGLLLDLIGAPFRYLVELIRWPFLDEEGRRKQKENLAKFDARIREQFRENLNAVSFGLLAKEKGAFGSIYGKQGTDAMGYTKDGKTKSQQNIPPVAPIPKTTDPSKTIDISKTTDPSKVAAKPKGGIGKKGAILGGLLGASILGPTGAIIGAALGSTIQQRGLKGTIGGIADAMTGGIFDFDKRGSNKIQKMQQGTADFMTLGMFDFDNQNRKGAPKDFGIRRIAGGLTDWATMGLTDFDKRGKGNLQFNPIGGGKDKAWGSRNEQAKRREKQSGFGLKRGIGGLLDFATLGMFDFDKQNRRGAPKGFGIKRIAGGLADFVTAGATDFDKRGTGIGQMKLGEIMSNRKAREAYENNARVRNFRNKTNQLRNMGQFGTKDGRTISMYDMLTSGDRSQIEEALYMQRVKERGVGEGHSDWVGNPEYEAETLKYLKPSSTNETPLKLGKQPMKFDEELLGVSASYETDGGQKEFIVYAPSTQINILADDNPGQLVTSGTTTSSGDDPYESLEKGN